MLQSATDEKISHLSTKLAIGNSKNTLGLRDKITTKALKVLHNKFDLVLVAMLLLSVKGYMLKF